jgi:multiple sugar transport system permease protein
MTANAIAPTSPPGTRQGLRFLLPLVVVLGLVSIFPTVYSLVLSLFDWNWGSRLNFVGLANYIGLLSDHRYLDALSHTLIFTVAAVSTELLFGMALALAVNRIRRGAGLIRTVLMVPLMVSGIIVSMVWKIMLDPTLGIVDYLAKAVGLPQLAFLGDPSTALASIVAIDVWWQTAFVFIILSAGLKSLPVEPFEAAEVDGASAWQRFRFVTVPMLRPIIVTILLFRTVDCMKVFAIIFGTTGGGPLTSTESVQMLAYREAFKQLQMSVSMAQMVVFSGIVLVIVLFYLRLAGDPGDGA